MEFSWRDSMAPQEVKHKLTAILSADVKGYSRLKGKDGAGTFQTLTTYKKVMANLIERHHGRVVDAPGDNVLAEFASVKGRTVSDGMSFGAAVSIRSDTTARLRHGLWRAECVTKGVCSVRRGATGDRWLRGHTTPVVYSTPELEKTGPFPILPLMFRSRY
jgi:class 3 adenylate cyclase